MDWYIIYLLRCSTAWTSSPPSSSTSSLLSTSISSGAPNHLFTRWFIFIFSLSLYLLVHPTILLPSLLPKNCSSSVGDWSLAKPSRRRTLLVFMRDSYFLCFSTQSGRCSAPPPACTPHPPLSGGLPGHHGGAAAQGDGGGLLLGHLHEVNLVPPCHCQVFGSGHQEPDAQDDKEGVQVHWDPVKVMNMAKRWQIIWFQGRKLWLQNVEDQNNLCGDSDLLYNAHPCANPLPLWQLQAKVVFENRHLSHFADSCPVLPTLWLSSCGQPGEAGHTI